MDVFNACSAPILHVVDVKKHDRAMHSASRQTH